MRAPLMCTMAYVITQVGFAFRSVEHALTMIVRNLESFSGLAAETERLDALATGRPPSDPPPNPPSLFACLHALASELIV